MSVLASSIDTTTYTAPDLLRSRAELHPDRVALRVGSGPALTFGGWDTRSDAAACGLLSQGVRHGDRIGLLFGAGDWIDYAIAYFGVLKAGATAVHLSHPMARGEFRRRLALCRVSGIVHASSAPLPGDFAGWTRCAPELAAIPAVPGGLRSPGDPVDVGLGPGDIADILFTSGTTGAAKAFVNPHGTLTFGRGPAGLARLDVSAPMLAPVPMGTPSSAMCASLMPLTSASSVILCGPGDVGRMGELITAHRVATILVTPWIAIRMVAARLPERYDLGSVTTVAVASAPLPAATARALARMMPGMVINTAYAQSEAVPAVVLNVFDPDRPASVGRPAPGTDLRVAGKYGQAVPGGQFGEIWLRSAAPKRLYLDEALNARVHQDGWTRTRDIGSIGADGDLYLFDREADAICADGELISTIEIEGALYEHPAVREAAVVGVPGTGAGPVAAVVVLDRPDAERDVRAFAARRLAAGQAPGVWHSRARLPRGITGKVLKRKLRAELARTASRLRICERPDYASRITI
jgi:acyl-CoA synthetase (AMP-forming)/AMP-acid ligase II